MVKNLLEVKNLHLTYGQQKILDNVSFEMNAGRILALIGPNGAGKSSTMRILAGLVKPDSGYGIFNGSPMQSFNTLLQNTGFFIEKPDFYSYLTAEQNLVLLQKIRGSKRSIHTLLEWVGLQNTHKKKVSQFSKGMKQRLGIAQALINDPDILILDEPFHGLDPEVKLFLIKLVIRLAKEENKAILISSHLLSDLEELADDFILLNKGKIHLSGSIASFKKEQQLVHLYFNQLPAELPSQINIGVKRESEQHLSCILNQQETAQFVQQLSALGYPPYKVMQENLLHSKYMEIAQ